MYVEFDMESMIVMPKMSISYLGILLDQCLHFREQDRIAKLVRIMPNLDDPRNAKRKLLADVVYCIKRRRIHEIGDLTYKTTTS